MRTRASLQYRCPPPMPRPLEDPGGVEQIGNQEPVHDEPRGILAGDGGFPEPLRHRQRQSVVSCPVCRAGSLDQLHYRDRVEEVHADELRGALHEEPSR